MWVLFLYSFLLKRDTFVGWTYQRRTEKEKRFRERQKGEECERAACMAVLACLSEQMHCLFVMPYLYLLHCIAEFPSLTLMKPETWPAGQPSLGTCHVQTRFTALAQFHSRGHVPLSHWTASRSRSPREKWQQRASLATNDWPPRLIKCQCVVASQHSSTLAHNRRPEIMFQAFVSLPWSIVHNDCPNYPRKQSHLRCWKLLQSTFPDRVPSTLSTTRPRYDLWQGWLTNTHTGTVVWDKVLQQQEQSRQQYIYSDSFYEISLIS